GTATWPSARRAARSRSREARWRSDRPRRQLGGLGGDPPAERRGDRGDARGDAGARRRADGAPRVSRRPVRGEVGLRRRGGVEPAQQHPPDRAPAVRRRCARGEDPRGDRHDAARAATGRIVGARVVIADRDIKPEPRPLLEIAEGRYLASAPHLTADGGPRVLGRPGDTSYAEEARVLAEWHRRWRGREAS